jgi:RNA polymerase sigma-70 factor (ECF subfamily)
MFRTYVYAVAMKLLWSERRREFREPPAGPDVEELSQPGDPAASLWVRDAFARLDEDHREVLLLREFEQLSYDEIAELLQLPINTVRSRLFRARAELKALLEPQTIKEKSQ